LRQSGSATVADASFDFIVTVATLEHVLAPDLAFAELERALAPGGVLYLAPAWHVRGWAAEGLAVRPYKDLSLQQKIRKALLPLLDNIAVRGAIRLPWRLKRRLYWRFVNRGPVSLRWTRLRPNYRKYWMSDSDAACSLDSHEGILYFESRGFQCLSHETVVARLFARGDAVVVRKPK
jgi:SAM-dependent methyltransferase